MKLISNSKLAAGSLQSKNQINLNARVGVAVREYQTDIGPADYVLFVDKKLVGISFEEQNNIIQKTESRLSAADKMEESINQSLQQAEALRQSILKKAFEGEVGITIINSTCAKIATVRKFRKVFVKHRLLKGTMRFSNQINICSLIKSNSFR